MLRVRVPSLAQETEEIAVRPRTSHGDPWLMVQWLKTLPPFSIAGSPEWLQESICPSTSWSPHCWGINEDLDHSLSRGTGISAVRRASNPNRPVQLRCTSPRGKCQFESDLGRKFPVVITGRTSPFFIGGMGQWWSPALQAVREISMGVRFPLPPPEGGSDGSNPSGAGEGLLCSLAERTPPLFVWAIS
jgi:hypothetical protein